MTFPLACKPEDRATLRRVSVIVPARNEARHIGACLESLRHESYPQQLVEIVVVDNGSTDNTVAIATAANVRVIEQRSGLVGAVRNAGARESSGDILAFLDADCVTSGRWLQTTVALLSEMDVGAAGGGYLASRNGSWVQLAWAPTEPAPLAEVSALPGGSLVIRRTTFEAIGGFNELLSAGEDDDLCRRVLAVPQKVVAAPDAAVIHLGYPETLRAVARRQIWHGSSQLDVATTWREAQLISTHSFAAGVLVLSFMIPLPFASSFVYAASSCAIVGPVLLMAYAKARRRANPVTTFFRMLPVAFFFYSGRAIGLAKNYWRVAFYQAR